MIKLYNPLTSSPASAPDSFSSPHFMQEEGFYYKVDDALAKAINVALFLGQPLLLTGDPGTGKTSLAKKLAKDFGWKNGERFFVFNTKSTSTYKDLLYHYDALADFKDKQDKKFKEALDAGIIRFEALGSAIHHAMDKKERCLVLIDEIDKAPRDLPNDILGLLDTLEFEMPEYGEKFKAEKTLRPIIIMTSNSERALPDAFLRRCVYHHISFPGDNDLMDILAHNFAKHKESDFKEVLDLFKEIQKKATFKQPSTAELLQWVAVLEEEGIGLKDLAAKLKDKHAGLIASLGVLLKHPEDMQRVNPNNEKA